MKIKDPEYEIGDFVTTTEGPRIVGGRQYSEFQWKDDLTKNWIYQLQSYETDEKTKEVTKRGNTLPYSGKMIIGKI